MKSKKNKIKIDIKHVAKLSKLNLSATEVEVFTSQLGKIINYVNELNEVETDSVEPTSQTTGLVNIKRNDKITPSLAQKEALSQKDNTHNGYFVVPMVLENKEM